MERRGIFNIIKRFGKGNQDALPSSIPDEYPEQEPAVEPVVIYECKDTRYVDGDFDGDWMDVLARHQIYNQSVSAEWLQVDPAEDYKVDPSNPSRIGPDS